MDVGIADIALAQTFAYSGVMLRGCGVQWDLRVSQPYETYPTLFSNSKIQARIPIGTYGDCFDRYLIRMSEMRESCLIILESINCVMSLKSSFILSNTSRSHLKTSMESLIQHFKLYSEGLLPQAGEFYTAVEAPKGEFGIFIASDGSNKAYRCKFRSPGFAHLQSLNSLSKFHFLADIVAIIGTLDLVFGEVDR